MRAKIQLEYAQMFRVVSLHDDRETSGSAGRGPSIGYRLAQDLQQQLLGVRSPGKVLCEVVSDSRAASMSWTAASRCLILCPRKLEEAPPTLPYHTQLIHIHGNRAQKTGIHRSVE